MVVRLEGGKKKRKKKVYTKPKKIAHKHKKVQKAAIKYFNVDGSGKVTKLNYDCEVCQAGTFMAKHPDRYHCGKCGNMLYILKKDGTRMPIPKQNKPTVASAATAVVGKPAAKGGKKKK